MSARSVLILAAAAALPLTAAELPQGVRFDRNGSFRVGDAEFYIQNYSPSWTPAANGSWKELKTKLDKSGLSLSAVMRVGTQSAAVTEAVTPTGENAFRLKFDAKFAEKATVNALHGVFVIPAGEMTVTVDGKPVVLPAEYREMTIYGNSKAKELRFTAAGGAGITVSGDPLKLTIQDNRKFGNETFALRFGATPNAGQMTEASLTLDFKIDPVRTRKVDLAPAANAGFADEVAYDGKGGWTDQGPDNDLRMIRPGTVEVDSLAFDIIDPAKNGGRGALVLSGKNRKFTGSAASLALPENEAGAVNLLHASAWTPKAGEPLGSIVAEYADGSSERIPVRARTDCGNWWNPSAGGNAVVGWSAENPESLVGLYASSFALKKTGPVSLRFEAASPDAVWMIAAVTLSDRPVRFLAVSDKPLEIKANYQWKPLNYKRVIRKGSALDFSFLADAPAGKYGFIRPTAAGTLTFEKAPGKRIRLYGPNLCFTASYLTKEAVDQLADYFVYCGYNTVRIHHHDTLLLDPKAPDTLTLSAEQLDKLDYLFFRMKEKGLYITTDLYTNRTFKPGDNIPECDFYDQRQMKMLIPVSRAAMASWKEFAKRWMTHRNPYTGLTWAEDPALYCINLINEETLTSNWSRTPSSVKLYEEAFRKYCAEKKLPGSSASNGNPVFRRFLHELQEAVLAEQIRFVKDELKMKSLVTSLNYISDIPLTLLRRRFDVVDNHSYFDHPGFPEKQWSLPYSYGQASAISRMAVVPRGMMASRLPGKPFLVTEFNYCNPNIYRAEGGPLIGGYAALQDWDALYRFAWSHGSGSIYKVGGAYGFDAANDPMAQLSDRIAIAMFRRGDVEAAKVTYAYTVPQDCFEQNLTAGFPNLFTNLGLIAAIGSVPQGDREIPPGVIELSPADSTKPALLKDAKTAALWEQANKEKLAVSATGQLRLDGRANSFTVTTPRTESVTLKSGSLAAGTLRIRNASCFQTVAAISLDGKALAESDSVLVVQLTNLSNTGILFGNESKRLVKKTGALPLLILKGSATVELASAKPYKVTALDCDGTPYGTVEGSFSNGVYSFKADTTLFPGGVMAYHLTR